MKITIDTDERRAQIIRHHEITIRSIKAKRAKLNKIEQEENKTFKSKIRELDDLERMYGNGNGSSSPKPKPQKKTPTPKKLAAVRPNEKPAKERTIQDKLVLALKQKPMTAKQLAAHTKVKIDSIRAQLALMKKDKLVIKFGTRGSGAKKLAVYSLTAAGKKLKV